MESVERYNRLLKGAEENAIKLLEFTVDKSFKRLIKRVRQHLNYPNKKQVIARNLLVVQDMQTLIPAVNPNGSDVYDRLFYDLLNTSTGYGLDIAKILGAEFREKQINAAVPVEAVLAAAKTAHGYLRRHGQTFAETATEIVMKGIAEGRPTDRVIQEMRQRLSVTKARARMIVRTESIRAYAEASDNYYAQMGIEYVSWYATSDDRVCEWCSPRAGLIYKRKEVSVPIHPQCRCFLSPYDPELAQIDKRHREAPGRHRAEVEEETGRRLADPASILNRASVFEQIAPQPVRVGRDI